MKILIFKGQICFNLETRDLTFWPEQILDADWIKSTKFEDGKTDVFSKIQFLLDISSRELRNQLHSSQYRQLILLLLFEFICESTLFSINTFVQLSYHSLKRIFYQISWESRKQGLEIILGPKDVSYLVDDQSGKALSKMRHDQPDLKRFDNEFFNDSTLSKARWAQGSTFIDE